MVVCVNVARGVGLNVGSGVSLGERTGVKAKAVPVAEILAASAVNAITVGRYSGGYAVGIGLAVGAAQAARSPRREARKKIRFMKCKCHCEPIALSATQSTAQRARGKRSYQEAIPQIQVTPCYK